MLDVYFLKMTRFQVMSSYAFEQVKFAWQVTLTVSVVVGYTLYAVSEYSAA
jgi:hypothetical protein